MPIHASPGVYTEVLDFSLYAPKLTTTTLALVGKTVKGPTNPTFISSVRQFIDTYGVPRKNDFSSMAAISFLEYGSACWFRRIVGAGATKASAGIPTAELKTEVLVATVPVDNRKYIYKATLDHDPIPGTVNVVISDPAKKITTTTINDDGKGLFDINKNKNLTRFANFIDYDTGSFRFSLDSEVAESNVFVKYIRKSVSVPTATLVPDVVDGKKITGTINSYANLVYKSCIKTSSLIMTIVNDSNTYTIKAKVETGSGGLANLVCTKQNGDPIVLTDSWLNLRTGEYEISFPEGTNLEAVGTSFKVSYVYDVFKFKNLGKFLDFTDTLGVPCSSNSISIYTIPTTVVTEEEIMQLLSDEYTCIIKDDGNGNLVDYIAGSLLAGTNSINYENKTINFALSSIPVAGLNISINYMSKNKYVIGQVDLNGKYNGTYTVNSSILPGSLVISIGNNIFKDDGNGSIVRSGVDYGDVVYKDTSGNASVTFNYDSVESIGVDIELTFISEMGNVVARSYGESFNGATFEFYKQDLKNKDITKYYGLRIWNGDQTVTSTPAEHFHGFTFDDPEATTYFSNRVVSNIVDFELYNANGNLVPILNNKITLIGGNDDADNINPNSAVVALEDFSNNETYDINLIAIPDFPGDKVVISELINLCENQRGDCFAIIDPPQNLSVQNVVDWHNGDGNYANENALNTNMGALYYPWVQVNNEFTESFQFVPPSVKMVAVYAYNDSNSEVWFAPAGFNRGRLFTAQRLERILNIAERDLLYAVDTNAVNPIVDFSGDGMVVYGQKTLQRATTAMNRVNVVRLVLYMTKVLATAVKYLLFEPNDQLTWIQYRHLVEPFMQDIKTRRGLYYFSIRCDETTNTPSDIDNNIMIAEITIQPTKSAERIINRFRIMPTGTLLED